jgi:hypothetical protein
MKTSIVAPLFLAVALASTASAQDVRYNFDREADFSSFKTYRWVVLAGGQALDELTDRQIKTAVDVELSKKGLSLSPEEGADLFIGYQAAIDTEKSFSSYGVGVGWGYGPGWYPGGWYGGTTVRTQTSTIYVGELTLDFYSPAPQTLVWRGVASKTLDRDAKPDRRQRNLERAVAKLLKDFPPKVKK